MWRLWSKALGEKASDSDKEADKVAIFINTKYLLLVLSFIVLLCV